MVDHQTFYLDLARADQTGLKFLPEYSALADLGMEDLSPASWARYAARLVEQPAAWHQFHRRYSRAGPAASRPCNTACRAATLCRLVTFDRTDTSQCEAVQRQLTGQAGGWGWL